MKKLLPISLFVLVLASCTTEKKANRFYQDHPEKFAEKCAIAFPVKDSSIVRDSISFDTLYIEQPAIVLKDSFYLRADTVIRVVTKQCPQATTLIKTIRHDSIIYRRNTAFEATLQYRINDLQKLVSDYAQTIQDKNEELKAYKNRVRKLNWNISWLIVALIGATCWIFRKPLLKVFA